MGATRQEFLIGTAFPIDIPEHRKSIYILSTSQFSFIETKNKFSTVRIHSAHFFLYKWEEKYPWIIQNTSIFQAGR